MGSSTYDRMAGVNFGGRGVSMEDRDLTISNALGRYSDRQQAQANLKMNAIAQAERYKQESLNRKLALELAAKNRSEDMKYRADALAATNASREAARLESKRRYDEGITRQDDIIAADAAVGDINIPRTTTVDNTPPAIYALDEEIARREQNGNPMKLGGNLPTVPQVSNVPEQSEFLAMYNGIKSDPNMTDAEKRIALRDIGATQQARLTQGTDNPLDVQPLTDDSRFLSSVGNYLGGFVGSGVDVEDILPKGVDRLSPEGIDIIKSFRDKESRAYQDKVKDSNLSTLGKVDKMARDEPARMKKEAEAEKARIKEEARKVVEANSKTINNPDSPEFANDPDVIKSKELIKDIVAKAPKTTTDRRVTSTEFKKSISEARKVLKDSLKTSTLTDRQKNLRIAKFNKVASAEQKAFNLEQATLGKEVKSQQNLRDERTFKRDMIILKSNLKNAKTPAELKAAELALKQANEAHAKKMANYDSLIESRK